MRDFQRSKVYKWESEYIHERLGYGDALLFDNIQDYVDDVWYSMKLDKPPKVLAMSAKKSIIYGGFAQREAIWVTPIAQWKIIILHELAHSMGLNWDNECPADSFHGPTWVGLYINLMADFLGFNKFELMLSATEYKIKFNRNAQPLITNFQDNKLYA